MITLPPFESIAPALVVMAAVAGVWLALTAIYVPGSGAPEIGSALCASILIAAFFFLPLQLPAIPLFLAALACFVVQVRYRHLWYLPIIGFALQIVGSFFLFTSDARPQLITLLVINLLSLPYFWFIVKPGLLIQNRPELVGADTLIGERGEVISTIDSVGSIKIQGAIWRARSDRIIPSGEWAQVIARDGLELLVIPSDPTP